MLKLCMLINFLFAFKIISHYSLLFLYDLTHQILNNNLSANNEDLCLFLIHYYIFNIKK